MTLPRADKDWLMLFVSSNRRPVALQWCDSGFTVVLVWCYSGVGVVLQWYYSGIKLIWC
jgi:hypothetical protein